MILTTHPPLILRNQSWKQCDNTSGNNEGNPSHIVPNITISETGRESLKPGTTNPNTELLVYNRIGPHQRSQSQPIPLGTDQSQPLGTGPPIVTSNSIPNSSLIPVISPSQEPSDLNIPIAVRKGT